MKTLKDITEWDAGNTASEYPDGTLIEDMVEKATLRKEAIEWIKAFKKQRQNNFCFNCNTFFTDDDKEEMNHILKHECVGIYEDGNGMDDIINWIKMFFNIKDEELM
jgi:hypothetical protein